MKTRLLLLFSWFCLGFTFGNLSAQNEGKEFWFTDGFLGRQNMHLYPDQSLDSAIIYVLGQTYCTGYVENPYTSYLVDFEVQPGVMTKIMVPEEEMTPLLNYGDFAVAGFPSSILHGGTIVIRTTQKVQVWVQTYNCPHQPVNPSQGYKGRAFKRALCPKDMYPTYYNDSWISSYPIFVIATEDNTQLYLENSTVTLNQGEVYYSRKGCDITTNCKRIIVYKGNGSFNEENLYHQHCFKGHDFLFRAPGKINFGKEAYAVINDNSPLPYTAYPYAVFHSIAVYNLPFHDYYPFPPYPEASCYAEDSVPYAYIRYQQESGEVARYLTNKVFSNIPLVTIYGYSKYGIWISDDFDNHFEKPTELMVTYWSWPISKNTYHLPSFLLDTTYTILTVYVHADGVGSTYLNGTLVPPSAFDPFPETNGEYYSAQWNWENMDTFPDYITIENPHGFSAYIDEIGYSYLPSYSSWGDIMYPSYCMNGTSGFNFMTLPIPHSSLSSINYDTIHRCHGDTLNLLVEHNPDSVPVEWIVDGISHLGDDYSFLLTALDTLTVQCVLHYECPDTTTTFVAVVPPPLLTVAHDTTVCAGATLSVEQPDALSYLWSNGATTPSITVDSAGMYQVAVTNIGCRAESDSFQVSLYGQSAVDFGNDSLLCELATLLLDATQSHPAQYFWQDASTNTTYTVYEDGDYWVVITDHCLGASDTIRVGYLNDFTVNLGPDTTLCEGKTLTLSPGVPYCDYLWQDGSTQPTYLVRGPGTYSVEVSNRCFSHWDAVDVEYEHCAQELYLPNAFTPGPDALNPVFLPVFSYPDEIEEYRMEIWNRWGGLVFRTEEKTFGWDGANAIDGVYAVVVSYKSRGEKAKTVKGSVTVVR